MKKILNKKAVLFSLISVLFSVLFITIFSQNFDTASEDKIPGSNIRIKVMDTYTRNFETYIGDSLKTSTYLTLNAITIYRKAHDNGFFNNYNEFNVTFYNCMMCGYTNCASKIPSNDCVLGTRYFKSRLDEIIALSNQQLNIKTEYQINSIQIMPQTYPFEVNVEVNISYNITDNSSDKYARWTKQKIITQSVSIIGLIEPDGYINDSTDQYARTISRYTGACEFDESCWNYDTTQSFYQEKSFRFYSNSTSFLQRYWNNHTQSNCCGIETILHPGTDLDIATIDKNNTYIDHYYWNDTNTCNNGMKIVNVSLNSEDVHLDEITASRYGLTNNVTIYCTP